MLDELLRGHSLPAKFLRYGAIGGLSSVFYGICTWMLVQIASLAAVPASACGYLLAIPFSFFMQKRFAFRSNARAQLEAPRFLLVHFINIMASIGIMHVTVEILQASYLLGVVQTMVLIPLLSFVAMHLWVFRRPDETRSGS